MNWIADNYGSRRGLVRHIAYTTRAHLRPSPPSVSDLAGVQRLVFICKGNICRSAMAEAVARTAGFAARSYGFDTHPGKPAHERMTKAAAALGHDLSAHRTTPVSLYAQNAGDLVLVFEPAHLDRIDLVAAADAHTALLGNWARPLRPYIHDPYGGTEPYFATVATLIDDAVMRLVRGIRQRHE